MTKVKIYTLTGDKGQTSLVGGRRVPKYHLRIESTGTLDELISHIGILRGLDISEAKKNMLLRVQDKLMCCCSNVSADPARSDLKIPPIKESDIIELESIIDEVIGRLGMEPGFILPGGHLAVGTCHVARSVCRRAERQLTLLASQEHVSESVLKYVNRLSDFLYVIARDLACELNVNDIYWKPEY